jgi:F0F1-type ATP synthase assembly protein I
MKLLPPTPRVTGAGHTTSTQGMDAALTLVLFFFIGFGLDRWLGTTPWFMIAMSLLAGIGYFVKFKYRYEAEMTRHEAERQARVDAARRPR